LPSKNTFCNIFLVNERNLSAALVISQIFVVLISRALNVYLCSYLANLSRSNFIIDNKKKFFLWFAGVRGAMAFALAIKSKQELANKETGGSFLFLTIIITLFTVITFY